MQYVMNSVIWTVERVSGSSPLLMRSNGTTTLGMCDGRTRQIWIADSLEGALLRKVLIHEVCHSAVFSYGIELDIQTEELICDFIASFGDDIIGAVDGMFYEMRKMA